MAVSIIIGLLSLIPLGLFLWLLILAIRALRKYLRNRDVRTEHSAEARSLGEAIKAHRTRCKMTQEFMAESIGVSRQAVSKWEVGAADPSTANLFALAKLFGIPPEELLRGVK